jgi:hypothetical protein
MIIIIIIIIIITYYYNYLLLLLLLLSSLLSMVTISSMTWCTAISLGVILSTIYVLFYCE